MNHPDLDRLTAWVHELLDPAEARALEGHVAGCAECRQSSNRLRDEARILAREIARPGRLGTLKARLLRTAESSAPLPAPRHARGLLWQIPVAAAVLVGLVAVLLSPGSRHSLMVGRVALEDGREVAAPRDFAASRAWKLKALEKASMRLADRSTVDLGAGSWIGLAPEGARGVQPELAAGEASFLVAPDPRRLTVLSPGGRVETSDGKFVVKIVFENEGGTPMKGMLAGAIVTVFAGSISLSNANGSAEASPGQAAVLAAAEAPLFLSSPQDKQEELLRRLEQLAARVAKLEDEIAKLEARNKQLKSQANPTVPGSVWFGGAGGEGGGFRVIQRPGANPGGGVLIELDEVRKNEKKDK